MLNHDEIFDIFNDQMERVGTAGRLEVHANGWWHQTFHCWIISLRNDQPSLLLQLRHPDKDTFPNLLDISCAGHLMAGENVEDGVRELEEELGLQVAFSSLIPCGIYAEEDALPEGRMDREFCHVFLYRCDQHIFEYRIQQDEVSGLYFVGLKDFESLIQGAAQTIPAVGANLSVDGQLEERLLYIASTDLVPHDVNYYKLLFNAINQIDPDK
ncbi:NUDIX domain-containing protein [Paenibacillus sp. GP183]|jgi:isopentenyldiphosphate isomerase|uniref:NUDIX hydrolase n=1 Tax=Paenibacillus sp. GP183 TaxID=1882751 RepID=UPI0008971772|nr:NUDIX domain-containing protein [Paenibacillus sp. GP183]SEB54918.1 Isopentenyldiphosphate isomerase [Paenibacillus sp. GP183]